MESVVEIDVTQIDRNEKQPRTEFDQDALQELAGSILATGGVLEPIVVRPKPDGRWEIVVGERRWRATKLAGLSAVKAIVKEMDDRSMALLALVENVVRQDLNFIEKATYLKRLRAEGAEWDEIAAMLGMKREMLEWQVAVVDTCIPQIQWLVKKGQMTGSMAWRLSRLTENGQGRYLREIQGRPMTAQEQMGAIEAIWAQENAQMLPAFEAMELTPEQLETTRSFATMLDRAIAFAERVEKLDDRKPGTAAAAMAHEMDVTVEKIGHLVKRLESIRRRLQRAQGRLVLAENGRKP